MADFSSQSQTLSELILEIFRLNRLLLDAGDKLTEPVGLTSARWQVLGVVEHGPVPVANIARIMGLTRQAVQRTADSLEADGLIVFHTNPHHRRAQLLSLTPEGRTALDYVQEQHADWSNRVGEGFSGESLTTALAMLRQIRERLDPDGFVPEKGNLDETESS